MALLAFGEPCWALDSLTGAAENPMAAVLFSVGLVLGGGFLGGTYVATRTASTDTTMAPVSPAPDGMTVEVASFAEALGLAESRAGRLAGEVAALQRDLESARQQKSNSEAAVATAQKEVVSLRREAKASLAAAHTEIEALRYELRITVEEAEKIEAELAVALPLAEETEAAKAAMAVAARRAREAELRAELAIQEAEAKAAEEAADWVQQAKAGAKKESASEFARKLEVAKVEASHAVDRAREAAKREARVEMLSAVEAAKAEAVAEAMAATGGYLRRRHEDGDHDHDHDEGVDRPDYTSTPREAAGRSDGFNGGSGGGESAVGGGQDRSGVWGDGSERSRAELSASTRQLDPLLEELRDKDRDLRLTGQLRDTVVFDFDDGDDGGDSAGERERQSRKTGVMEATLIAMEEASFVDLAESASFKLGVEDDAMRSRGAKGLKAVKVKELRGYLSARGLPIEDDTGKRYSKNELVEVVADFLGI